MPAQVERGDVDARPGERGAAALVAGDGVADQRGVFPGAAAAVHQLLLSPGSGIGGLPTQDCKARIYLAGFAGLSGVVEVARNAFANRHNSVTCTCTP
jgi:hypothetical protein